MARAARELRLSGVIASAVTPHRAGTSEADFSAALDLLDFLAKGGANAVAVGDAVGEFPDYSLDDRQRLVYLGVKRSRVPLIAGVSHPTLGGAVQLAQEAVASGADGLIVMPPCFFRYGQAEIEEYFREFAAETGDAIPILLHHAPEWASGIEPDTIARLMATGRFAGIVDSSGDVRYREAMVALRAAQPMAVLCGCDRHAGEALRSGVDGLFSPCAGAVPELMAALFQSRGAERVQAVVDEMCGWLEQFPVPAGLKRAVELRGQKAGASLVPLAAATAQRLGEFEVWFRGWVGSAVIVW